MAIITFKASMPREQHFFTERDHIRILIMNPPKLWSKSCSSPVRVYQPWWHLTKNWMAIPWRG
ncbi:unnamed protein product [Fusarium venenatum]|uniref:Uncharacterized protein n=1 Tax=Fusarium venenatum TaxID=56646 RepID=A0A2L2T2N4_9HYPO|nr:uncharacterized protein FVRRES_01444 [Fusarium venenatum]CEI64932.1 unnamed protein product [Fusarium venenatum]